MSKSTWILLAVAIAAAVGGGAYYVVHQQTLEIPAQVAPAAPAAPESQKTAPEDLTKKKLDGIGSTRSLKPVQIPQGPAK